MASRNELAVRARSVGLDPSTYPNDSKLEQKVLWLEKNATTFAGALGAGTLTDSTTRPTNNDIVTIGSQVYTWKTALSEASATATLTVSGTPTDGDQVQVGNRSYVFRTTLTNGGTAPDEVLIQGSAANALINLKAAINNSGTAGTQYGTGNLANLLVSGTTLTTTTLVVQSLVLGTSGNRIAATVPVGSVESWSSAFLSGGVDPVPYQVLIGAAVTNSMTNLAAAVNGTSQGSLCSTGTGAHPQVTATSTATTVVLAARDYSVTNASVATTVTSTGSVQSWGAATLTGGVVKQVALDSSTYNGSGGLSGDRDV